MSDVGYIVVDVWRSKPGMGDQVDATLKDAAARFRAVEGIVSVDYARLDNHDDMYLVVFRYSDEAARDRFTESDDLKATMSHLRQLWDLESPIYRGTSMGF